MTGSRPPEVHSITGAGESLSQEQTGRTKRYLISMSLRSLCFVGAVIAGLAGIDWLWPILIAGALILPYIAVVLANVQATRMQEHDLGSAAYTARALGSGGEQRPLGASSSDRG